MFRNVRMLSTVVLILLVTIFLGVGCSPAATSVPPTAPPPQSTAASQATTVPPTSAPPKPALAADQVLRFQLEGEPPTIDPQKSAGSINIGIVMTVFENLLAFGADGKLVPATAAALPTVSADGLVYTVKLREGLKYSDGQPLTARNFEFGWKRSLDPAVGYPYAFSGFILKGGLAYNSADPSKLSKDELQKLRDAVGVKALDDLTLQFTLIQPAAYFPYLLAIWTGMPTRQDMVEKGGDKWAEPPTYIGNGPYVLTQWDHNVKMVFEANPNYRLGAPTVRRLERIITEQAAILAYQNDELDGLWVGGATEIATIQSSPTLKQQYIEVPQPGTWMLLFGATKKPFDNVKVRQAFSMAIDHQAWIAVIEKGLGFPAEQFVPPGVPGNYPDLKTLKFDPAAARKLLADAGYPDGKGLPEIKLTITPAGKMRGEFIQAQLKENLGVDIKLDTVDGKTLGQMRRSLDTFPQLSFNNWYQDYSDPQDWYSTAFNSKATAFTPTGWKNAQFDKLTEQADVELDSAKRDALYKQAAQILMDESPVAFLDHTMFAAVLKPWVKGCQPSYRDFLFLCRASIMQMSVEAHGK